MRRSRGHIAPDVRLALLSGLMLLSMLPVYTVPRAAHSASAVQAHVPGLVALVGPGAAATLGHLTPARFVGGDFAAGDHPAGVVKGHAPAKPSSRAFASPAVRQAGVGKVAFTSARDGQFQIYVMDADGSNQTRLTNNPEGDYGPAWSPDGTKLAYTSRRGGKLEVRLMNADGSGQTTLSHGGGDDLSPAWSPDGTRLALASNRDGNFEIYSTNVDGSGQTRLTNNAAGDFGPVWSPDGTKLAFVSDRDDGNAELYLMNADGAAQTRLTNDAALDFAPAWSPDGTKISFTSVRGSGSDARPQVYSMHADGSAQGQLTNDPAGNYGAVWSPDGARLAFVSAREGHDQIYTMKADGTLQTRLGGGAGSDFDPHWQALPPARTLLLAGRVTADGSGLGGAEVELSGSLAGKATTDDNGNFTFAGLPLGGSFVLVPSKLGYTFLPQTRAFNNLSDDLSNADFNGVFVPANINGRVTDSAGKPLAGIEVTAAGGSPDATTLTDAGGLYSFPNVRRGFNYVVTPSPFTAYKFEPGSRLFPGLTESQTADFVGTRQPTNVIKGRVVESGSTDKGIGGIQVSLARDGSAAAAALTDSDGRFLFADMQSGHAYSVAVSFNSVYTFEPKADGAPPLARIVIDNLTADQNLSFVGTRRNAVEFASTAAAVGEGDGGVEIAVTRSGDIGGAATVSYATHDATASERSDYTLSAGSLHFAPGEKSKSFRVLLTDDALVEGAETLTLSLSDPVGANLGGANSLVIEIRDNDSAAGAVNPVNESGFYVRQHYLDFFNREPDPPGLAFWTQNIESCKNAGCREAKRIDTSAAFFLSIEFQQTGYLVYRTYKAAYGNLPGKPVPTRITEFLPDTHSIGDGVVVGAAGWESQLESNKRAFMDEFVTRARFTALYPQTMSAEQFVNTLNANSGGVLSQAERDLLVNDLKGGAKTRAEALRAVAENDALARQEFNGAFVLMQYFGYLRRDPDSGRDTNFDGYNFWLAKLNNFNGDYRRAEMVKAFISSDEYVKRFGQ
jgi:Tol biopolymer transport system component